MPASHLDVAGLLRRHGYKLLKTIGQGSFGKAILVQNEANNSQLVCKMVDISKSSPSERAEIAKEAKILANFKHPYVVRYRESFLEAGWLCILMDYCEGGDLASYIEQARKKRQPIPEEQVLVWMTQAMLALKHIHDRHVLHRDLKAGNFFLTKSGTLKIGDFGIAKALSSTMACARTQIGTPYYLSPEVCEQKPYAWASDVWAMGVILFELCERRMPFDAPSIPGLVRKITRDPAPPIGHGYSNFVRSLCVEMLGKDPRRRPSLENILSRPQIKDVVRKMLEAHRASTPPSGPSPSVPSSAPCSRDNSPAVQRRDSDQSPSRGTPRSDNQARVRHASPVRQPSSRHASPSPAPRIPVGCRPPGLPCQCPAPPMPRRLAAAGGLAVGVAGG
jgi:NIMA (never in mitosis gene a)-related kinase